MPAYPMLEYFLTFRARSWLLVRIIPPSPLVICFELWKLKLAISPSVPTIRPLYFPRKH